jgi:hypothetical protein
MSAATMTNSNMSDQERIKLLEELYLTQTVKIDELIKIVTELRSAPHNSDPIKPTTKKSRTHCKCGSTEHKNISHKDCPMNKLNNPFAEASDEPKPAPKKRGRPRKADKEVVSTSEENPIDEMLSNLTLNVSESQETVINEDAFPSPNSEPEAKKQIRDEEMMDLELESQVDDLAKEVADLEEDKEKAKEIENAEKAAKKAEKAAKKAEAKEIEKTEKAAKKAQAKEIEKAEKAAKKAEAKEIEKAEKAKEKAEAKEIENAQKAKEKAEKVATIAEKDEADKKKVVEQLDTITKMLQHPDTEMDAAEQFEELEELENSAAEQFEELEESDDSELELELELESDDDDDKLN